MPKTQNAFALKDWDEDRLFQRPFFKSFGFNKNLSDSQISQSLKIKEFDSVEIMEEKLSIIKKLYQRVVEFNNLIDQHTNRLDRLYKIRMDKVLQQGGNEKREICTVEYFSAKITIGLYLESLRKDFEDVEKKIQVKYRDDLAKRLKALRKRYGLTQKEFGEKINVSPLGYSRYERGDREIPLHTLIRIAKVYNLTGDEILGFK